MNRRYYISKIERIALLVLVSTLLVAVLVALGLDIAEEIRLRDLQSRYPSFSIDAPRRALAGLNLLTIPLFLSVVFARRYFISGVLTVLYIGLLSFGVYLRLDGRGFLGGEGFYQNWVTEVFAKTHWFEWMLPFALLSILFIHLTILYRNLIAKANTPVLP